MKTFTLISALLGAAYAAPSPAEAIGEIVSQVEATEVETVAPLDSPKLRSTVNGEKILPRLSMSK
jgi:hypothetical protein